MREAQELVQENRGTLPIKPRQNLDKTSLSPRVLSRIDPITDRLRTDSGPITARIWKYAAMLLMVLTLGVGEMWG